MDSLSLIEGVQEARRQEALLKDSANPLKLHDDLHGILGKLDGDSFSGLHCVEWLKSLAASDLKITNIRPLPGGALMVDIIYKGKPYRNKTIFPPNMTYKDIIKLAFELAKQIDFTKITLTNSDFLKREYALESGLRVIIWINLKTKTIISSYPY